MGQPILCTAGKTNITAMSLITDSIFIDALKSDTELTGELGGRIYCTAIPLPDEELDNVPLPYAIVSFRGFQRTGYTKDSHMVGDTDNVNISLLIAATTRPELGELMIKATNAIDDYFEAHIYDDDDDFDLIPVQYDVSDPEGVQYDSQKPCYWQRLNYQCETYKD